MKRTGFYNGIVLLLGLIMLLAGAPSATAAAKTPSLAVDGQTVVVLTSPPIWENGAIMLSLRDISTCLGADLQRNEQDQTAWVQKYGHTLLFRLQTGEVYKNSDLIAAPVPARLIKGQVYAPLRFVAENLGLTVAWDGPANRVQIITGERRTAPERVTHQMFNAVVAYGDQGNLWLLDGRWPNTQPQQITNSGRAELIGWSPDGTWLAYTHTANDGDAPVYLWVVKADGSGARQVDAQPIYDDAQWSPRDNRLVYTLRPHSPGDGTLTGIVKIADIKGDEIKIKTLLEQDGLMVPSLAWHPNGESITVSFPRTAEQAPSLWQVDLTGQREMHYTLKDETPIDPEGLYDWAFIGLKWSPDGRYLGYHVRKNAGSLTADVVETGVLDAATKKSVSLGDGLQYPQWLAFSPDGEKLAHIAGVGREAMFNKQLEIVDLTLGRVTDKSEGGFVDIQPVWLPGRAANELLFCRGPEAQVNQTAAESNKLPRVLVPGQRIYMLDTQGQAKAITAGPADTADYYPSPSLSGEEMIFLRLERFDQGSLYLQPLNAPTQAVEVLRGLRGDPGYYGSYYPRWCSVHWF